MAFGLIVSITNLNGLEHDDSFASTEKTRHVGVSLIAVALFGAFFAASCFAEMSAIISVSKLTIAAGVLAIGTACYSFTIWHRVRLFGEKSKDNRAV